MLKCVKWNHKPIHYPDLHSNIILNFSLMKRKFFATAGKLPLELIFWCIALTWLAVIDPSAEHYSFCFYRYIGIDFCPGCGIGHSISLILHGNFQAAFESHFAGFIAVPVILWRIYRLICNKFRNRYLHTFLNHPNPTP